VPEMETPNEGIKTLPLVEGIRYLQTECRDKKEEKAKKALVQDLTESKFTYDEKDRVFVKNVGDGDRGVFMGYVEDPRSFRWHESETIAYFHKKGYHMDITPAYENGKQSQAIVCTNFPELKNKILKDYKGKDFV